MISSPHVLTYVMNHTKLLIIADEKAGKTTITKTLVKDLHRNGRIPILLNGSSIAKYGDRDRLQKEVNVHLDKQYGQGQTLTFWQLAAEQRLVIVDDFHKMGGNRKAKDRLITLLNERFGGVILVTGEGFLLEEIASPPTDVSPMWEFQQCTLREFGQVLRHAMISKWCRLGREFSEDRDRNPEAD